MKITLTAQDGIAILTGSGEIGVHDLDVLRAGFGKLLKAGRNRIVFEITESDKIPGDMIREISKFDIFARELSGRIVLAGSEALCSRVGQFARPPVISCFASKELALQNLKGEPAPPAAAAPTAAPRTASSVASGSQTGDAVANQKAEIRQKELTDLTSLRKRIAVLENENNLLMGQLLSRTVTPSSSENSHASEVAVLNQKIEGLLLQLKK